MSVQSRQFVWCVGTLFASCCPSKPQLSLAIPCSNGNMEAMVADLGLKLHSRPVMMVYQDGAPLAMPATQPAPASPITVSSNESGLPLGAIIGISVGAVVLLAAIITVSVLMCERRAACSAAKPQQFYEHSTANYVGATAQLSISSNAKGTDSGKFVVVKGGGGTPITPSTTFNAVYQP